MRGRYEARAQRARRARRGWPWLCLAAISLACSGNGLLAEPAPGPATAVSEPAPQTDEPATAAATPVREPATPTALPTEPEDDRPPQGIISYSANPAPAGDLLIAASFDEPLAAAPLISVSRPGVGDEPPQAMTGDGSEWRFLYPVRPAGDMGALAQPLTVVISGVEDVAGNKAVDLVDESAYAHAPDLDALTAALEDLHFVKYDQPILEAGPPGGWDGGHIDLGDVLKVGDAYLMYYTAADDAGRREAIGLAYSQDGVVWEKLAEPVITTGPAGAWDSGEAIHPSVLWHDGVYHMWYVGLPEGGDMYSFRFGHTTSADGILWAPAEPVLGPGPAGAWDEERIGGLDVVRVGGDFVLYYSATTLTPEFERQIGCAVGRDGVAWFKCEQNPIFWPRTGRAAFEGNEVEGPSVAGVHGQWLMAYTGYGGPQGANFHIGLARSEDAFFWKRLGSEPALEWGPPGSPDETGTGRPSLLIEGNKVWMWYTGHHADETSIMLAVAILD